MPFPLAFIQFPLRFSLTGWPHSLSDRLHVGCCHLTNLTIPWQISAEREATFDQRFVPPTAVQALLALPPVGAKRKVD